MKVTTTTLPCSSLSESRRPSWAVRVKAGAGPIFDSRCTLFRLMAQSRCPPANHQQDAQYAQISAIARDQSLSPLSSHLVPFSLTGSGLISFPSFSGRGPAFSPLALEDATSLSPLPLGEGQGEGSRAYPFNSFFSSLRNRQSVPWAMSFCGLVLIIPASCRRRA